MKKFYSLLLASIAVGALMASCGSSSKKNHDDDDDEREERVEYKHITPDFQEKVRQYDRLGKFTEGLAPVEKNGKMGFIDSKGDLVIPCEFDYVGNFEDGTAFANKGNNHGIIDKNGEFSVSLFDYYPQLKGYRIVKTDGGVEIQNDKGKSLSTLPYDGVVEVRNGIAVVYKNDRFGAVDFQGNVIVPVRYEPVYEGPDDPWPVSLPSDHLIAVYKGYDDGTELFNTKGELLDFVQYPPYFSEGLAAVSKNDKFGYINEKGDVVIPFQFTGWSMPFSEGLAAVQMNGKWGYIDKTGTTVVPFQYDSANGFSEGLAAVGQNFGSPNEWNYQYGYIDKRGEVVIPLEYKFAESFSNGTAQVAEKGAKTQWGYESLYGIIDKKGNMIVPAVYQVIYPICSGLWAANKNEGWSLDGWGVINDKGEEVLPFIFSFYLPEGEGETFSGTISDKEDFFPLMIRNEWDNLIYGYADRFGNTTLTDAQIEMAKRNAGY